MAMIEYQLVPLLTHEWHTVWNVVFLKTVNLVQLQTPLCRLRLIGSAHA